MGVQVLTGVDPWLWRSHGCRGHWARGLSRGEMKGNAGDQRVLGDISTRTLRGQGRGIRGQKSKRVRVREKGSICMGRCSGVCGRHRPPIAPEVAPCRHRCNRGCPSFSVEVGWPRREYRPRRLQEERAAEGPRHRETAEPRAATWRQPC